jgi:hypothetical protein
MIDRLRAGLVAGLAALLFLFSGVPVRAADVAELLKTINAVGPEGQGNAAAAEAVKELSQTPASQIVSLLTALDAATPRSKNALRAAIQTVAQKAGRKLPASGIETFVQETKHDPAGRKLAFDLLLNVDATAADRLVPGMIDDPSAELRRLAVQRLIEAADKLAAEKKDDEAKAAYQKAMQAVRDSDQITVVIAKLSAYGEKVNLTRHLGFLTKWSVIGPFDNREKKGFDVAYPPEKGVDLAAEVEGKDGMKVKWVPFEAPADVNVPEKCGTVDLNKALGKNKGAIIYAVTEFESPRAQTVEFRLGTFNAWKVWLNGEFVFGREEYHRGERLDQYKLPVKLKAGTNQILIKVCENEQTEEWAQDFLFRLRVCDQVGTAIHPVDKTASR